MSDDRDQMAALFLSIGGELGCFPERMDERFFYVGTTRWDRLSVPYFLPEAVAVGILRLIRERDEARQTFIGCNEDRERACEFERRFEAERDVAQETVETFRTSMYVLEERAAQLSRERDEAKQKAADWEQTARELMKVKVKP